MRRRRNAKGTLESYGPSEVELPGAEATPPGWSPADQQRNWSPSAAVVFDPRLEAARGRAGAGVQPLTGIEAVKTILRFFNLRELQRQGRLREEQAAETQQLQDELRDPAVARGPRGWMRVPVEVDVLLGPGQLRARMTDIGAGGLRLEQVHGQFMVGNRLDVVMGFGIGGRRGNVVFATRIAWVNAMRQTMGMEFTAPPRWKER